MTSPRKFSEDDVQSAHFCTEPSFVRTGRRRGRRADGLRYEKKANEHLCSLSDLYLPGPWIIYVVAGKPYWCQPDGLNLDYKRGVVTIVEVKLNHTAEAIKLRDVYEPVVRRIFQRPQWGVKLVEVTRWYDPDVPFPEATSLCARPFEHMANSIGVHIWRP